MKIKDLSSKGFTAVDDISRSLPANSYAGLVYKVDGFTGTSCTVYFNAVNATNHAMPMSDCTIGGCKVETSYQHKNDLRLLDDSFQVA